MTTVVAFLFDTTTLGSEASSFDCDEPFEVLQHRTLRYPEYPKAIVEFLWKKTYDPGHHSLALIEVQGDRAHITFPEVPGD